MPSSLKKKPKKTRRSIIVKPDEMKRVKWRGEIITIHNLGDAPVRLSKEYELP